MPPENMVHAHVQEVRFDGMQGGNAMLRSRRSRLGQLVALGWASSGKGWAPARLPANLESALA